MATDKELRRRCGRGRSTVSFVLVLLCIAFFPALLAADDEPTAAERQREGLTELRTANDAFDEDDFETAYEHYVKAFELLDEPMVKYRMGQTAEKIGEVEAAIEHYEAYLEVGDDEEFLGRIDEALPRLRDDGEATVDITSDPEGATIFVVGADGSEEEAGQTPATVDVVAGDIHVALRLDGYEQADLHVGLEDGEEYSWDRTMVAEDDAPETLEMAPPVAEPIEDPDDSSLSLVGWTSAGLGAGVVALGGVMTYFQRDTTNEVNEFDRQAAGEGTTQGERDYLRDQQAALRSDAETYHRVALLSFITGGALLAAGTGILIYDNASGDEGADETGFGMRGGFSSSGGFIGVGGQF